MQQEHNDASLLILSSRVQTLGDPVGGIRVVEERYRLELAGGMQRRKYGKWRMRVVLNLELQKPCKRAQ